MEATIEIRESEYTDRKQETYLGLFGRVKYRDVILGQKKHYTVYLTLIPSEEERAIILKYKIDELAIEEERTFSDEQLAEQERDYRLHLRNFTEEQFQQSGIAAGLREMRQEKKQTLLNQYFDNPYTKGFDTRQDAHTYADKLEKEILPMIKSQIDYYRLESVRQDKRTITL